MAHITLPDGLPGIRGLLTYSPATAKPIGELAEVLLRGPSTLSRAERELVAAHVSFRNDCHYCQRVHGAIAAEHLGGAPADYALIDQAKRDAETAPVSGKMRALLAIAGLVQQDEPQGRGVHASIVGDVGDLAGASHLASTDLVEDLPRLLLGEGVLAGPLAGREVAQRAPGHPGV